VPARGVVGLINADGMRRSSGFTLPASQAQPAGAEDAGGGGTASQYLWRRHGQAGSVL